MGWAGPCAPQINDNDVAMCCLSLVSLVLLARWWNEPWLWTQCPARITNHINMLGCSD